MLKLFLSVSRHTNTNSSKSPTYVESTVGHHVLVVVESMLNIILCLFVTEKPLQNIDWRKSACTDTTAKLSI